MSLLSLLQKTGKWSKPAKSSKGLRVPRVVITPISNRFSVLGEADKAESNKRNCVSEEKSNYTEERSTNTPSTRKTAQKSLSVINFSHRLLNKDEIEVLDLGLTFSPSVKTYNKEQLSEDFFTFFRRLKLKEYFFERKTFSGETANENVKDNTTEPEEDQCKLKWEEKNPHWYPYEVRNNRTPALNQFMEQVLTDTKQSLNSFHQKNYNNLSQKKREALKSLASDESIVIKPSDKCGSVVVMNRQDYEKECLKQLSDKTFYEECNYDPNEEYKELVAEQVENLFDKGFISKFHKSTMLEGDQTPNFYGLPKTHSSYDAFPPLRPISNGHSSCTTKLSEYIDSFLKCCAQKTESYIKDTTSFINKIKNKHFDTVNSEIFLCSMDVNALYPNIDHTEGTQACEHFLNLRKTQSVPTKVVTSLILLVLKSHTLNFLGRFFHQIKGTAMGTPMAVNFANLFMSKFEQEMLADYKKEHKMEPEIWIRYIDDIFMIWKGDQKSLKHFLDYCNMYSKSRNMQSNIIFKYAFSKASINFLDVTVSIDKRGHIQTELFEKPTAAHRYLHHTSYHVPHIKTSLPKSQFLRIRRVCSSLDSYRLHAKRFIDFFVKRGYKKDRLEHTILEVMNMDREEMLSPQRATQTENKRTPLVITWNHKFTNISKIIHNQYTNFAEKYPQFKETFPEPPIVAYRNTKNLRNALVRANHWKKKLRNTEGDAKRSHTTKIDSLMNTTGTITNQQTGRTFNVPGGKPSDTSVVYAAECTKHNVLYTGQTGGKLSTRFGGHRSDVIHYPERCELAKHYHENDCEITKDLRITILEHVQNNEGVRLHKEAKWMTRLQTIAPNGLNSHSTEYATIYKSLFE